MSVAPQLISPEDYLRIERAAEVRSEYYRGRMFAMAGAGENHNLIVWNLASELRTQFKGRPCKAYSNDMRVKVSLTGLYTYPDVIALCGQAQFEDAQRDTLLNPQVVFEVLSRTTEAYDRGDKFAHYRRVATITDYVLVSSNKVRVEHFHRQRDGVWILSDPEERLVLPGLDVEIPFAEIYDKVDFNAAEPTSPAAP